MSGNPNAIETDVSKGYHALPDAPALPDAIEAPYVVEKAPSVYPGFQPTRNSNASNVHTHFHARATSSSDGSQDFASHGNFGTAYETTGPSVAPASRSQPRVEYSAGENSDLRPVDRETTSPEQQFNGPVHHYHQPSSSLDASGMSSFHIDPERPLAEPETVPYPNFVFKGSPSQENQNHAVQYALQPNFDIMQPNQRGGKRGPFKDPVLREKTAKTRKMGSCVRCRMQRIRVSAERECCYIHTLAHNHAQLADI